MRPGPNGRDAGTRAITLESVYKVFAVRQGKRHEGVHALNDVNLDVEPGSFVSLVGPSGCGKSTILNLVTGLSPITSGRATVNGAEVRGLMRGTGYVTQEDNLLPWRTAIANVEYGLELQRVAASERRALAQEFLDRVGLSGFEGHYPHQLSGGMRKRVSIGRTLVLNPSVILMDEPFGPLDAQTRIVLQNELLELWRGTGTTIVFVTHDLVEAIALSDEVVVMTRRPGTVKSVHRIPLSRPRDVFHIHAADGFAETYERIWSDLRSEIEDPRVTAPA